MPTSNLSIVSSGTGFSVNVAALNLSADLTQKDFIVLKNGIVEPLTAYAKASQTQISYSGVSLTAATLEFRRATLTSVVTVAQFGTRIRSQDWNDELDRISRRAEEYALNGVGAGSLVTTSLPQNDAFGVLWSTDTTFPPNRKVVYDKLITLADIASPTFTGVVTLPSVLDTDSSLKAATTVFVKNNLLTYAPLASPTFTGTPVLPSATVGVTQTSTDSTTKLATTAFVQAQKTAPTLTSPVFTGTPTAPTPSVYDNSTKVATTAYVNTANTPAFEVSETVGGQPVAHGGYTVLTYNTETLDTHNAVVAGTFTVPAGMGGYYLFSAGTTYSAGSTILLLDVSIGGVTSKRLSYMEAPAGTNGAASIYGSGILKVTAGDVVSIKVIQLNTTSATRTITNSGASLNYFSGFRLNVN